MTGNKFNEFVEIVKRLRKECPWDREQTNDSIKAATIEEAYEVVEAIEKKNYDNLKSELLNYSRERDLATIVTKAVSGGCEGVLRIPAFTLHNAATGS